ncbi:hypothetical protein V5799_025621 [Amblyomma americanum]|uniref:Uncharacterized protein n=1 Tax=Amblyomma americanum TaxID=6943 RepID=A0AAQ4E8X9_AMBAM
MRVGETTGEVRRVLTVGEHSLVTLLTRPARDASLALTRESTYVAATLVPSGLGAPPLPALCGQTFACNFAASVSNHLHCVDWSQEFFFRGRTRRISSVVAFAVFTVWRGIAIV